MNDLTIPFTFYNNLKDIDRPIPRQATWAEFVKDCSTHLRVPHKEKAPGFGPYVLDAPPAVCTRHVDGRPRTTPHRCDSCVVQMTMCVFDVDAGTPEQIAECERKLTEAGLAQLWYTSYSYRDDKDKPPFRLVVPLARPLAAEFWPSFRLNVIKRYSVPCVPTQCAGRSHFYYLPSCPPDSEPLVHAMAGRPLDPDTIPHVPDRLNPRRMSELMADWEPEEEPTGPVDLAAFREEIERRARSFEHSRFPEERKKGVWLRRLLKGEPLAEHGERNIATAKTAGVLGYLFHDKPVGVLMALLRPSVRRMQAAGSSLTDKEVERMLVSAIRKKAEELVREEELARAMGNFRNEFRASLPVVPRAART